MFCKNCGKQLAEGTKFCDGCGAPIESAPAQQPAQQGFAPAQQPAQQGFAPAQQPVPAAPNPMFTNFAAAIKGFFSPQVVKAMGVAAKSKTLEWIFFVIASVLSFALSATIDIRHMLSSLLPDFAGASTVVNYLLPFFSLFGINLLIGLLTYVAVACGIWVVTACVYKKQVAFFAVLNMVGFASIPLTLVSIVNMVAGLWLPLGIVLFIAGVIMSCVLLYIGIQKLEKLDKTPFFSYSIVMLIVVVVALLATFLLYKAMISSVISGLLSDVGGLLGGSNGLDSLLGGSNGLGSLFGGSGGLGNLSSLF